MRTSSRPDIIFGIDKAPVCVQMRTNIQCVDAVHPCEVEKHIYCMSIIPTPLHRDIKEPIPKKPVSFFVFFLLSPCPYGVMERGMPRSEVAGTNNYDQRNYNAKGTDATFSADKSLRARGHADIQNETGKRRRSVLRSTMQQLFL